MAVQIDVDLVGFIDKNASVTTLADGSIKITTGNSGNPGAEYILSVDGTLTAGGESLATEQYVLDAVSSSVPPDVVTSSGLDNKLSDYAKNSDISASIAAAVKEATNPAWITPTLQNGWGPYAGPTAMPVGYRKVGGMVQLRGLIGGGALGTTMWVMPAGFRPKAGGSVRQAVLAAGGSLKYTNMLVESTGVVKFNATDAANLQYVSLTGLSYPCED